jgi:hypothetical protein
MKKGRHRRFEEARNLKRSFDSEFETETDILGDNKCDECGAPFGEIHADWCLAETPEEYQNEDMVGKTTAENTK